jgi:N-carbamoyl-L-amino-acid hydrolase
MAAAAHLVLGLGEPLHPGLAASAVTMISATPQLRNVRPGRVVVGGELRALDRDVLDAAVHSLRALAHRTGEEHGVVITSHVEAVSDPTDADPRLHATVAAAADRLGLRHRSLPCLAGHDAQILGARFPMAMILVPSRGGLSHCAEEHTEPHHLVAGANVLLHTVLALGEPGGIERPHAVAARSGSRG